MLKLHVLEQGYIEAVDAPFLTEDGDRESVTAVWPVRCHLVEHSDGWLLWDTGLPEAPLLENPLALGGSRKVISSPMLSWLGTFGLGSQSDMLVGLSHLHIDHGGNANCFTNSTFLIGKHEYSHAMSASPSGPYYRPGYDGIEKNRVHLVGDRLDVFGDGMVVIYSAPGHSPGHQALLVNLPEEQPVLLVGDACYSPADLIHRRAPVWNHHQAQTFRTLTALEQLAQEKGARMVIHHDPAVAK